MEIHGIDVSAWQGNIDWAKVAEYGIDFAILRITEAGNVVDSKFERNFRGCVQQGIPTGVYKYSYAMNVAEAREEARKVVSTLNGRKIRFPVFMDLEWKNQRVLGAEGIHRLAEAFEEIITEAGYKFGIYCNVDWYNTMICEHIKKYDFWIARYPGNDNGSLQERFRPDFGIGWQYTSKGRMPGISGYVDRDVFYKDYSGDTDDTDIPDKPEQPEEEGADYTFQTESVRYGSRGLSVLLLQEILKARDFRGADGKALALDRIAGINTIHALRKYQQSRKGVLEADGICGYKTWRDLIAL